MVLIVVMSVVLGSSASAAVFAPEIPRLPEIAVVSSPAVLPAALAPQLAAPAISPAPLMTAPSVSVPAAPATTGTNEFSLIERTGRDNFGHAVLILDILDSRDPSAGTVAHIDMSYDGDQAHLDGPLDSFVPRGKPGVPEGADISHFRQYLWFGLAVKPDYQGHGLGVRLIDEAVNRLRAAGIRSLFIRATDASRGFYIHRFGPRVVSEDSETDRDGETYHLLEIDLR